MAQLLGVHPGHGRLLEVGAADGQLLAHLGYAAGLALDLTPPLKVAVPFVQGDGRWLPFSKAAFEMVVAFDVLEHVPDTRPLLSQLFHVLQPGGTLWLSVPSRGYRAFPGFLTAWLHRRWGHLRPGYEPEEMVALLPPGISLERIEWNEPAYRLWYAAVWALGMLAPAAARAALRLIARYDAAHRSGRCGHYFFRVTAPGASA